jgi:hypothetical protein
MDEEGRANALLLLNELDVAERLGSELDSLVEPVLTTVRHINNLDNLRDKTTVEQIGRVELRLEVGRSGKNESLNVDLVVGDEVLHGVLSNLPDVVVTLLHTETGETKGRLSSATVLLREVD